MNLSSVERFSVCLALTVIGFDVVAVAAFVLPLVVLLLVGSPLKESFLASPHPAPPSCSVSIPTSVAMNFSAEHYRPTSSSPILERETGHAPAIKTRLGLIATFAVPCAQS